MRQASNGKIVAVCGSPRQGNTELMLNEALKGAKSAGAQTKLLLLRKLPLKMPTGHWPMPVEKNLKKLHDEIMSAQAVILGSPAHFSNMSSLMKIFVDRTSQQARRNQEKQGCPEKML